MIDENLIEQVKSVNKVSKAIAFEFLDADGGFATKTKRPVITCTIEFANGRKFSMNWVTFQAFGEYKFDLGIEKQ